MLPSLWALLALLGTGLLAAADAGTGVGGSLVPVASYESVFPFAEEQLTAAMAAPPPELPAALPGDSLAFLKSSERKLTQAQAQKRHAAFKQFFDANFPGLFESFQPWAQALYKQFVTHYGLADLAHFKHQGELRAVLYGMRVVGVFVQGGELNHFSLLDPTEAVYFTGLAERIHGQDSGKGRRLEMSREEAVRVLATLPTSYDMRTSGKMPPIRNQMQCGSCWAFTTSSTLEIQNIFVNGNSDIGEISEQAIVSCDVSGPYANSGCNGGSPYYAWEWINSVGGLPAAATYPYTNYASSSVSTPACSQSKLSSNKVLTTSGASTSLPSTTSSSSSSAILAAETAIMQQVYAGYPVTIQVSASGSCFQSYRPPSSAPTTSQMMTCSCGGSGDPIDHVILVVGWTPQYFIARNQWGTSWGVNGYAYLPRNSAYPTSGYPKTGQCNMLSGPVYLQDVEPIASSAPVTTASPVVTNVPTQYPTTTGAPVTTNSPVTTLVPTSRPTTTKAPLTTGAPVPTYHPTTKRPSVPTKLPVSTATPSTTKTPHSTSKPSTSPPSLTCATSKPLECVVPNHNAFCCPYVCFFDPYYGSNVCTDYVCCTNGVCAQFAGFDSSGNPMVTCASNGRRALRSRHAEAVEVLQSLVSHADAPGSALTSVKVRLG